MAARWDLGVVICDFCDLQAKANMAGCSWDLSDPRGWDLGFDAFGTGGRALELVFGIWVLGRE